VVSRLSQGRLLLFPAPKAAKVELPAPFVAVENNGRNIAWLLPRWCQQVVENLSRRWVKAPLTTVGSQQPNPRYTNFTNEFRYLKWRNPHLYKLYVRGRYLKLLLTIPYIFLELGSEDSCDVFFNDLELISRNQSPTRRESDLNKALFNPYVWMGSKDWLKPINDVFNQMYRSRIKICIESTHTLTMSKFGFQAHLDPFGSAYSQKFHVRWVNMKQAYTWIHPRITNISRIHGSHFKRKGSSSNHYFSGDILVFWGVDPVEMMNPRNAQRKLLHSSRALSRHTSHV